MRFTRSLLVLVLSLLALASCSRDPNVLKQVYLEKGNKWFDRGKYREALLMYRDALQKDKKFAEAHYRLALTYMKLGSVSDGVRSLLRSLEFFKNDPHYADNPHYWDALVQISQIYLDAAPRDKIRMAEVEQNAKLLLARDANSFDGHNLTAELANVRGAEALRVRQTDEAKADFQTALEEYRKADSIKPGQLRVLMHMGGVYVLQGDLKAAEEQYRKVIGIDKTYVEAYRTLYRLSYAENQMDAAEQVLKDGYRNNPKQFSFLEWLALFYWTQHRRDDMLNALGEIKKHASEYPRAYLDVGEFYYRLRDGDAAIREYNEGIEKDPKHRVDYQKRKIEVLMHQNKRAEAAGINQQILDQNPNDPDAKSLDATLKLDRGDIARALAELQQVVTQSPDNFIAHFNLGRAYAMQGQVEQARQQFNKSIELRPDYIAARIALAQVDIVHGEYEAGAKTAEGALAIDPNNLGARLIETAALIGEKKFPEARTMLDAVLVTNPNSADVIFQLAVVDMSEKKFKDAETRYRKVYEINPDNFRALVGLSQTFILQGKIDEALSMLKTESDKRPGNLDLRIVLADTAQRTGRYAIALENYQHVVDSLDKNSKQRADIMVRLGEVYRKKGDLDRAISYLSQAKDLQPQSLAVLIELALTLDQAKDWGRAKTVYEAALKINPNEPFSLNNLAYLEAEHGGDLNQAQTLAQRAKQFWPDRPEVSDTLGWIYLKRHLSTNAVDIFRELVRTNPQSSTFHYHLCEAYDQQGDKAAASRECSSALRENPSSDEAKEIRDKLARLPH